MVWPFSSSTTVNNSARSTRPPSYQTGTPTPSYPPSEPRSISPYRLSKASLGSTSSVSSPDSDVVFDHISIVDTASIGMPGEGTRPNGPRYIYYRVYVEDGPIPTANPVYTNDRYLGRIPADFVAPPQTAKDIKLCLSGVEHICDNTTTSLFISTSKRTPIDDGHLVSISTYPGPGCVPHEPIALVAKCTGSSRHPLDGVTAEADRPSPTEGVTPFETQYLYYRVYNKSCAVASRQPADSNNPWVGRLSVDSIPPPHTATSIMRCISNTEELVDLRHPRLYINTDSKSPIGDRHISILTNSRPGSTPENPMAFVESLDPPPIIERGPEPRRMRVINVSAHSVKNPSWLKVEINEILTTVDDEPRQQQYKWFERRYHSLAYTAVNAARSEGFVCASCVAFV